MNGFSSRIHKQHLEHFLYMYKNFRQHLNEWVLVYISRSGCQRCYWEYEKQADTPDSCTGLEAANTLQGREQIEVGLEDLWKPENFHCPALSSLVCVCVCVCVCTQSYPIFWNSIDLWGPPGSSVHGISQAGMGFHFLLQGIFLTWSSPHLLSLLYWQAGSLPADQPGKPMTTLQSRQGSCFKPLGKKLRLKKVEMVASIGTKPKAATHHGGEICKNFMRTTHSVPYSKSIPPKLIQWRNKESNLPMAAGKSLCGIKRGSRDTNHLRIR